MATQYFGVVRQQLPVRRACARCRAADRRRRRRRASARTARGGAAASRARRRFLSTRRQQPALRARSGAESRLRITAAMLQPCYEDAALLMGTLDLLEATAALIKPPPPDPDRPREADQDWISPGSRSARASCATSCGSSCGPNEREYVYFLEIRGRGVFLRAAPIDVSKILRDVLFDRMKSTVLTSATLTVDGSSTTSAADSASKSAGRDAVREAAVGVRLPAAGDSLSAAADARPALGRFHAAAAREIIEILEASAGTRVRAVHELRRAARGPGHRGGGAALSDARAGNRAALGAARAVPDDAATRSCWRRRASGRAST